MSHEPFLGALAAFLRPALYLELGTADGQTISAVLPFASRVIGVDVAPLEPLAPNHEQLLGRSVERLPGLEDGSVDLAFIDSFHSFDYLLEELAILHSKMKPTGVVAIHDTVPPDEKHKEQKLCGDVYRIRDHLASPRSRAWIGLTLFAEFGLTLIQRSR